MTPPKSPPQHPQHTEPPENLAGLGREGLLELPAPVTERQVLTKWTDEPGVWK